MEVKHCDYQNSLEKQKNAACFIFKSILYIRGSIDKASHLNIRVVMSDTIRE